jgi:hypothetical protein
MFSIVSIKNPYIKKIIRQHSDTKNTDVYYYRGVLEMREHQQAAACADFAQALKAGFEITDKEAIDFMKKWCPKGRTYIAN